MPDGAKLAAEIRAFIRALFVMSDCEPRPRPVAQFFIARPPVRKD